MLAYGFALGVVFTLVTSGAFLAVAVVTAIREDPSDFDDR